jgi:antitoxin HicB
MENMYSIHLKISKVENGQYLAESEDIPGLVAQGRTVVETIEIAQDVARKLIESYVDHGDPVPTSLRPMKDEIELDVAVGV